MVYDSEKSKELINSIHSLISGNNSWEDIKMFFEKNEVLQKYYKPIKEEMNKAGNYGYSVGVISTLEEIIEELSDYQNEENGINSTCQKSKEELEKELIKTKKENTELKKENDVLQQELNDLRMKLLLSNKNVKVRL